MQRQRPRNVYIEHSGTEISTEQQQSNNEMKIIHNNNKKNVNELQIDLGIITSHVIPMICRARKTNIVEHEDRNERVRYSIFVRLLSELFDFHYSINWE